MVFWKKKEPGYNTTEEVILQMPKKEKEEPEKPTNEELLCAIRCATTKLQYEHEEGTTTKTDLFRKRFDALLDALVGFEWCQIPIPITTSSYSTAYLMKSHGRIYFKVTSDSFAGGDVKEYDPYDPCIFENGVYGRRIVRAFADNYDVVLEIVKEYRLNQLENMRS